MLSELDNIVFSFWSKFWPSVCALQRENGSLVCLQICMHLHVTCWHYIIPIATIVLVASIFEIVANAVPPGSVWDKSIICTNCV